jgi:hypothetical protein
VKLVKDISIEIGKLFASFLFHKYTSIAYFIKTMEKRPSDYQCHDTS